MDNEFPIRQNKIMNHDKNILWLIQILNLFPLTNTAIQKSIAEDQQNKQQNDSAKEYNFYRK